MELFKSPAARLARLFKTSRDAWKAKALERQQRLRAAQVKIRDLEHSRACWKARALAAEEAQAKAENTRVSAEEPPDAHALIAQSPPAGHQYPVHIMQWSLQMFLQAAAFGSRGVTRVLGLLSHSSPNEPLPAYTTILNWVYRFGLAVLNRAPERRNDWIYIADHTIALGLSKCLVVLGIPASELSKTGYSPSHQAMQVLAVEVTTHSTGPWVAEVLGRVAQRTGPPVQIVADHGSDLRCGITLFQQQTPGCVSTYDISHAIATLLKAELGQDDTWNAFLAGCSACSSSLRQSDLAFLLPPRQRTKARFMSLDGQVRWAQRLLAYYDRADFSAIAGCIMTGTAWVHLRTQLGPTRAEPLQSCIGTGYPTAAALCQAVEACSDLRASDLDETFWNEADFGRRRILEGFAWLLPFREQLTEYAQLLAQSKQIQTHLKTKGLHHDARAALQAAMTPPSSLTPRAARFTEAILAQVDSEAAKIPPNQTWLATSDIIESVFGKYKGFTSRGPLKEIGRLVLAIPAFLTTLTPPLIREAMESVRTLDIGQWVKTHIGISMLAQRRQALIDPMKDAKVA
jgi:hypothetical protein